MTILLNGQVATLQLAATLLSAFMISGCSPGQSGVAAAAERNVGEQEDRTPYSPASPGAFVVNTESDEPDAQQGDGRCATAAGECSLRAAVQESNATVFFSTNPLTRTNIIIVPEGHYRFIESPLIPTVVAEGTSDAGMLSVLGSTNIRGAGAQRTIIDGNGIDRVFGVGPNALLSIADVTIRGGTASGIFNQGQLTVQRSLITENFAGSGGGIFNTPSSSAIIESSTISNNIAESEGGGIRFDAAGLVINSTISGNRILDSCCDESTADGGTQGEGGGIDARGGGPVTIINSTIVNNHAAIGGGGINIATSYQGDPDGFIDSLDDEVIGRPVELINTIIAHNTSTRGPANCKRTISKIYSLGGNVSDDDSCFLTNDNDLPNTDPGLGFMANHGGHTETYTLLPGSPARENGLEDRCPADDQSGQIRPRRCDAGAFNVSGR
jgi:CSLREA domain-containing protein